MNTFLARFAVKHMKLGLSRTWVLPDTDGTQQVYVLFDTRGYLPLLGSRPKITLS
jgi:hypothetical protein